MKARTLLSFLIAVILCASQDVIAQQFTSGSYYTPHGRLWYPLIHVPPVRDYRLFVPSSYAKSSKSYPLVVMLHGCKQNAESFAAGTGMNVLAENEHFLVLYPNQHNYHERILHRCWSWSDGATQNKEGEAAIIVGMVNEITKHYRVDASRIYVAGLSAGGAMTSVLASCYPSVFAAAAIHSGVAYKAAYAANAASALETANTVPPDDAGKYAYECSEVKRFAMPVIVFHGTRDGRVNPRHAEMVVQQFAQLNDYADDGENNDSIRGAIRSRVTKNPKGHYPYTVVTYHQDNQLLLQLYWVHGMGHSWSGGSPIVGTDEHYDPRGPNASKEIWKFFKVRRRELGQ